MILNKTRQSCKDTICVPRVIKFTEIKSSSFIVLWKERNAELLLSDSKVSAVQSKRELVYCKESQSFGVYASLCTQSAKKQQIKDVPEQWVGQVFSQYLKRETGKTMTTKNNKLLAKQCFHTEGITREGDINHGLCSF